MNHMRLWQVDTGRNEGQADNLWNIEGAQNVMFELLREHKCVVGPVNTLCRLALIVHASLH